MRVVLFDLDDTLLDYSGGVEESWRQAVLASCADGSLDPEIIVAALAQARQWFWEDPARNRLERTNMPRAWHRIATHALEALGAPDAAAAEAIARHFGAHRRETMQLFPEARETLERLHARGTPLGLVTNGDAVQQRHKIEAYDLARFFDVVVIEGEFGAGKPDEVVFRHALASLGVAPADACMVGDHLHYDVHGAQRLGMRAVWIDRARAGLPRGSIAKPDHIIASLRELPDLG
jgi:putative hydrolase of the HAD superfamily